MAVWVAWGISWIGAAWWSRATERRADLGREMGHRIIVAMGAVLVAISARRHEGLLRLWQVNRAGAWICVAAMVCGFAFCWWARIHLARSGQHGSRKRLTTGSSIPVPTPSYVIRFTPGCSSPCSR